MHYRVRSRFRRILTCPQSTRGKLRKRNNLMRFPRSLPRPVLSMNCRFPRSLGERNKSVAKRTPRSRSLSGNFSRRCEQTRARHVHNLAATLSQRNISLGDRRGHVPSHKSLLKFAYCVSIMCLELVPRGIFNGSSRSTEANEKTRTNRETKLPRFDIPRADGLHKASCDTRDFVSSARAATASRLSKG